LAELLGVLFSSLAAFYLITHAQLGVCRKRVRFLEAKVDALIEHTGIELDDSVLVPVEVHAALEAGHRVKAIRIYRKITGAGLKEASGVVNALSKKA